MSDFGLITFVNEVSKVKKNGIPAINLRVKQFKADQKCDPNGVID